MKNHERLVVMVMEKNEQIATETSKIFFSFEVNIDLFSLAPMSQISMGTIKLQGWHFRNTEKEFRLVYINWNETNSKRCLFTRDTNKMHTANGFSTPLKLMIWISAAGQLNVIMNGNQMESNCYDINMSSADGIRFSVALLDMKPYDRTTNKLFDIFYEINDVMSKLK